MAAIRTGIRLIALIALTLVSVGAGPSMATMDHGAAPLEMGNDRHPCPHGADLFNGHVEPMHCGACATCAAIGMAGPVPLRLASLSEQAWPLPAFDMHPLPALGFDPPPPRV